MADPPAAARRWAVRAVPAVPAASALRTVADPPCRGAPMTEPAVLVVDDGAAIREALERALRLEGFAIRTAAGGREALDEIARNQPALILLDVTMPDLDGVEVIKRLRAQGSDLPICVLSARNEVDDRVRGLQAGADDYLVKPFALEELIARLHALLRRRPEAPAPR